MHKIYREFFKNAKDIKAIGENCLMIHGDSLDVIPETGIPVDSIITDPPYDFDSQGGKLFGRSSASFYDMRDKGLSEGFDFTIIQRLSITANQCLIFMHQDQIYNLGYRLSEAISDPMLKPLYDRSIIGSWHKTNPMPVANKHYVPDTEHYIHAWRSPAYPMGELKDKSRWMLEGVGKSEYAHPTVKPQSIMRKCVINASSAGQVVIDPFCGSGSTGVACLQLGRKFIGIEKDAYFYEMSCKRLAGASGEYHDDLSDKQISLI